MTDYDCTHRGHHLHEPDGSVYVSTSKVRPSGQVALTCCQCGAAVNAANRRDPTFPPITRTETGCTR